MIEGVLGKPGAGKTTLLASYVAKNDLKWAIVNKAPWTKRLLRPYDAIYVNDSSVTGGCIYYASDTLGHWKPISNSQVLMSEAGVYWNNRNTAKCDPAAQRFWARHRHMKCDIVWESQTVDVDIKLRQRTSHLWVLEKMPFGFSHMRRIGFKIGVNNDNHKVEELYYMPEGLERIMAICTGRERFLLRCLYYRYFDSWSEDDFVYDVPTPVPDSSLYSPEKQSRRGRKRLLPYLLNMRRVFSRRSSRRGVDEERQ